MTGIVAVTASAAIDRTYRVEVFERSAVNRADTVTEELSGKGVNVVGALTRAGVSARAVVPLGPAEQTRYAGDPGLVSVPVRHAVRVNISLLEGDGTSTKINQQPSPLDEAEWNALVEAGIRSFEELGGGWLALCGSLPQLAETGETVPFEQLVERARIAGARVAVDLSGEPLRRVCAGGIPVDLIKPNTHELAEAVGEELRTIGDVLAAADRVRARGIGTVYVSMGADGVLVVGADGYRHALAVAPALTNTVGAGDASLAGFLSSVVDSATLDGAELDGAALDRAAQTAAAWGALAVSQHTTILADPHSAPPAILSRPALDTVLTEPGVPPLINRKDT